MYEGVAQVLLRIVEVGCFLALCGIVVGISSCAVAMLS